ncbi:poly-beta-1,6-N-acetyl-D-glucosamine N-deacetylase PgaB [Chrysiogenes arsenatis]|uniref:poly-beta-1,6-N-acetyl-D-glucosamine N-deacetylase PgaB n=1 Tax=Chrysiogenes arsenatis TaxID=309797 RepID=UPI00135F1948|nr:poly-beta-1,6-N-acetyl-D-glucosamine N-deacetylase PgaB [Chrysiogenes arsenatis]
MDLSRFGSWDVLFATLKAQGYHGVILRAFHNQGDRYLTFHVRSEAREVLPTSGVYFTTALAPTLEDHFLSAVPAARAHGLTIYGWLGGRRTDWLATNSPLKDPVSGRLSLFTPASRHYVASLFADLARTGVDGILIQDDLVYRTHDERPETVFVRGASGYTEEYIRLAHARAEVIAQTVREISTATRAVNPDVALSMNLYYEAGLLNDSALMWLGQDVALFAALPVEQFTVMSYHRQISQELSLSVTEGMATSQAIVARLIEQLGKARVVAKVQTVDFRGGAPLPRHELVELLQMFPPDTPRIFMPLRGVLP